MIRLHRRRYRGGIQFEGGAFGSALPGAFAGAHAGGLAGGFAGAHAGGLAGGLAGAHAGGFAGDLAGGEERRGAVSLMAERYGAISLP